MRRQAGPLRRMRWDAGCARTAQTAQHGRSRPAPAEEASRPAHWARSSGDCSRATFAVRSRVDDSSCRSPAPAPARTRAAHEHRAVPPVDAQAADSGSASALDTARIRCAGRPARRTAPTGPDRSPARCAVVGVRIDRASESATATASPPNRCMADASPDASASARACSLFLQACAPVPTSPVSPSRPLSTPFHAPPSCASSSPSSPPCSPPHGPPCAPSSP